MLEEGARNRDADCGGAGCDEPGAGFRTCREGGQGGCCCCCCCWGRGAGGFGGEGVFGGGGVSGLGGGGGGGFACYDWDVGGEVMALEMRFRGAGGPQRRAGVAALGWRRGEQGDAASRRAEVED